MKTFVYSDVKPGTLVWKKFTYLQEELLAFKFIADDP
jgi:hypothetical protein